MTAPVHLARSVRLPALILYGLGTMVGGGFYALLGQVAGEAGMNAPLAFLGAGVLALLSGSAFAVLSARFPVSAGEARYVDEAFGRPALSGIVGWLVVTTGVVSAATLAVATTGFLQDLVPVPQGPSIALLTIGMGLIAAWGIGASVRVVAAITIIEVAALLVVFALASRNLGSLDERLAELAVPSGLHAWTGVFTGAFLAFYSFLGFEDMVNLAEEVRDVRKNLPRAIFASVFLTLLLYLAVATVAVLSVPLTELRESRTPLATVLGQSGPCAQLGIRIVSLLTGLNGALVQIVMAARVIYGMAERRQAPEALRRVHPKTRTPVRATTLVTAFVGVLALFFPLVGLARATSSVILVVFALVNLAAWRLRATPSRESEPRLPRSIHLLGAIACAAALLFQGWLALVS